MSSRVCGTIAVVAIVLGGCASTRHIDAPRGISSGQETADRARCKSYALETKLDPRRRAAMREFADNQVAAGTIGAAVGGGVGGLIGAAITADQRYKNAEARYIGHVAWQCLQKKGYTLAEPK